MKKNEKKYEFLPPEGQEINWSPRGALLINVFFGWELLGKFWGISFGAYPSTHFFVRVKASAFWPWRAWYFPKKFRRAQKNKRCTGKFPGILPGNDTFFPLPGPPRRTKKMHFFHIFSLFFHFPDFS